jgi:hypothetical protein
MVQQFSADVLRTLDETEEVEIETSAQDGRRRRTIIWVVVSDGAVYVRSVRGPAGRWYRELTARPDGVLHAAGLHLPVHAVGTADPATVAAVSQALRRKYDRKWPQETASMLREHTLSTTLRLEPT